MRNEENYQRWYKNHYPKVREKQIKQATAWRKRNRALVNARQREKAIEIKRTVFEHYGLTCACCQDPHYEFLTIDHIADNGAEHRRKLFPKYSKKYLTGAGGNFYRWLIKNEFPEGYQTLCWNCNWAKSHGGCPHQREELTAPE